MSNYMMNGTNQVCDSCNKTADWRARDPKTNNLLAAACVTHKETIKAALIAKMLAAKGRH